MITIRFPILICSVTRICQSSTTGITFSRWSHYYANKSDAASLLEGISFMYDTGLIRQDITCRNDLDAAVLRLRLRLRLHGLQATFL